MAVINGTSGKDTLSGTGGDDTLTGGLGNDVFYGNGGNDIYVFAKGAGQDTIFHYKRVIVSSGLISFVDVESIELTALERYGDHLVIKYGNSDEITVSSFFQAAYQIEKIKFSDDVTWDVADINGRVITKGMNGNDLIFGTDESGNRIFGLDGTDSLHGGSEDDLLDGGGGADFLSGYAGNDILNGGDDADKLLGDEGNDTLNGGGDTDFLDGNVGNDLLIGGSGADRLLGGDGGDTLNGGEDADVLFGEAGNDILDGGDGADTLEGGAGNDTYYIDNLYEKLYDESGVADVAYISISNYALPGGIENVIYVDGAKPLPYFITALASGYYWGDLGKPQSINYSFALAPTAGLVDFQTYTDLQQQHVREALGRFSSVAGVRFSEVADAELVDIRFFRDDLSSGGGINASGYAGYPKGGDVHIKSIYEDYQYIKYVISHEIGHALGLKHPHEDPRLPSLEDNGNTTIMSYNVTNDAGLLGIFDLATVHYIYGVNSDARVGDQTYKFSDRYVWDGAGIDTFSASNQTIAVNVDLNPGSWIFVGTKSDSIRAQGQAFIGFGTLIENAIGGAGNDVLLGNTLANRLDGLAGNDSIDGGAGNDTLVGGEGDDSLVGGLGTDTASYAGAAAAVTATLSGLGRASGGAGADSLSAIENLLGSSHNDSLTGNVSANRLDGGSGNDSLNGGAGNDTLTGGAGADNMLGGTGDDLFGVDNIADVVREGASGGLDTVQSSVDFVLGANIENLRLLGTADIKGTGNSLANTLWAAAGNNVLDGAGGNDTASYADSAAGVIASLSSRNASGGSGNDTLLNFENLVGSSHDDYLTGNGLANMLAGFAGADTLKGGAGADTMTGGAGSDLYYVDDVGDLVVETGSNLAAGMDMVYTSVAYQLTANVENLRITNSANVDVTGNSKGNLIYSGAGNNVIDAGAGRDTLSYLHTGAAVKVSLQAAGTAQATGGSGTDTLYSIENLDGSNYGDTLDGHAASNVLNGGKGNDVLKGRGDTDWLDGGAGRDRLIGGTARDDLTGGLGADVFEYNSIAESKPGGSRFEWDIIVDFNRDEGDRIDLYSIDADLALAGNQAFVFITGSGFTAAGQVLYDSSTGMLYANVNADSDAELAIQLLGAPVFTGDDLIA